MSDSLTQRTGRLLMLPALLVALAACAGPSYYAQAISGHFDLVRHQQDIEALLQNPDTEAGLAAELRQALEIRRFAIDVLGLPDSGSYTHFVATGREAVTWNVFAAPKFSLEPKRWCFPVAGCVPYRGYFDEDAARRFAARLAQKGYDVATVPATAYSTLGWFDDPLLDTMLGMDDMRTAAFLFHEMAHQDLYVRGDAAFNEAYASFIEDKGVELWLQTTGRAEKLPDWRAQQAAALQFNALLQSSRDQLAEEYRSEHPPAVMQRNKTAILDRLRTDYRELVESAWHGRDRFGHWFGADLNNARLAMVASYRGGACAFEALFEQSGDDLGRFREQAAGKARLSRRARTAWLNQPCEVIAPGSDL
jgi:predicted aminopeptidase